MSEDKEVKRLRRAQAREVMPLIGGLLDAWDGMALDLREQIAEEKPAFADAIEAINEAMENAE